jgi:hypothetical protein
MKDRRTLEDRLITIEKSLAELRELVILAIPPQVMSAQREYESEYKHWKEWRDE